MQAVYLLFKKAIIGELEFQKLMVSFVSWCLYYVTQLRQDIKDGIIVSFVQRSIRKLESATVHNLCDTKLLAEWISYQAGRMLRFLLRTVLC